MPTFEEFELSLRHVLIHFRDPAFHPPELLWSVLGYKPHQGVEAIQTAITQTIQSLKPASANTASSLRNQRFYELLTCRYIQELTQEETADRLGITPRHVRREQQQAVHMLARLFWEKRPGHEPPSVEVLPDAGPEQETLAWRSQVREELAALQQSAPGSVVEVAAALRGVMKIGQALTSQHGITLQLEPAESGLTVAMHPSVLRQVLITAIEKLAQSMAAGQITLAVERIGNRVRLLITGTPAVTKRPPNSDLIQEILAAHGDSVEAYLEEDQVGFRIELPTVDKATVLVIDDNADLVHFYRRYTTGTRYQIVHLAEGQPVPETISKIDPDIIVLDVMLPDTDGWELLTDLREQLATHPIPIIVCSVIRRAELALSLGASLYLPKPVGRQQFIEALDQVLPLASVKG
ncbi:MAG: response regulator [Anaerolineae bacterium]|nr:response regulator [Anaerolineae bacterium]